MRVKWPKEITDKMRALFASGMRSSEIAKAINYPYTAVESKIIKLGLRRSDAPRVKVKRRTKQEAKEARRAAAPPRIQFETQSPRRVEPPEIFQARALRLAAPPRDLSAEFFGDPPVGYSALEQRR